MLGVGQNGVSVTACGRCPYSLANREQVVNRTPPTGASAVNEISHWLNVGRTRFTRVHVLRVYTFYACLLAMVHHLQSKHLVMGCMAKLQASDVDYRKQFVYGWEIIL